MLSIFIKSVLDNKSNMISINVRSSYCVKIEPMINIVWEGQVTIKKMWFFKLSLCLMPYICMLEEPNYVLSTTVC
jgi:hypothetical protein